MCLTRFFCDSRSNLGHLCLTYPVNTIHFFDKQFKKGDLYFNYGCFPQTWEDPTHVHPDANARGDNDPLDVVEIGARIIKPGVSTCAELTVKDRLICWLVERP